MGDLIYRLLLFLNSSKEDDINYTIATTMLHNINNISHMQINKLADICYTSPAAISRFCRKLGYSNLSEFKKSALFNKNIYSVGSLKAKGINLNISREDILNNMSLEINEEILELRNSLDLKIVDLVIDLIFSSTNVSIFGTQYSQLMAQELQRKLIMVGKLIYHRIDVQEQEKLAEDLKENSLAILISPAGRFTLYHENLWNKIKNSKATVVIITENKDREFINIEYKNRANYIIYLPKKNDPNIYIDPHRYALTYLIEYIYVRFGNLYMNKNTPTFL